MYDVTGTTASECSLPQGINPNSPSCLLVTLKSDTTVVKPARTNILFDQLNTANQVWGRWFGDLARAWWVILVCAVGVSLVLGFSFVTLLKYCTGCMVWSTILLCLLLLTLLTGFFYYLAGLINYVVPPSVQEQLKAVPGVDALLDSFTSGLGTVSGLVPQSLDGSDPQSYQSTYAIIAYTSTAFLIIVLCIVIAARKSISTAVDVLKLGAEALRATPTLVIFPFTSVVALTLFLCWWVFIAACLASAGSITPGAAYSDVQAGAVAYATSVGLSANSTLALLSNPAINTTSVAFTESSITSYLLIYHFFGLLWTASFIQGVASLTVAGAVAGWYFSQLPKGSEDDPELAKLRYVRGRMPVCASLFRTLRFYLGSVAIGSLLIAFVQLVRTIFAYISRQLKKNAGSNSGINFLLCCINCCLKCLQACVEVITRTAYIYIAIKGDGFIRSGRRVFSLIINHGSVFFVVNVLAEVIVFLGKVLIAVSSAFIAYALLNGLPVFKVGGADQLSSTWLPILVTLFFAYFVASAFMSIYDMAVDTVLVWCVCCSHCSNGREHALAAHPLFTPHPLFLPATSLTSTRTWRATGVTRAMLCPCTFVRTASTLRAAPSRRPSTPRPPRQRLWGLVSPRYPRRLGRRWETLCRCEGLTPIGGRFVVNTCFGSHGGSSPLPLLVASAHGNETTAQWCVGPSSCHAIVKQRCAEARAPPGEDALVERKAHGVGLRDGQVEAALHGTVRADALCNVAARTVLGVELDGLEISDVLGGKEHVLDHRKAVLDLCGGGGREGVWRG